MRSHREALLYENEAYRLTSSRLEQPGVTAEIVSPNRLRITRPEGVREVEIPSFLPEGVPAYRGDIPVLSAMYAMAVGELQDNLNSHGLLLAGANWNSVWTRDIAYSAALGAALAMPQACAASLRARVKNGVIMQDTGTGGGWPISTDRIAWVLGAWSVYVATGDRDWLQWSVEVTMATLKDDERVLPPFPALRSGETSFMDWREQSYPDGMSIADIGSSYAFGTNVVHYMSRRLLSHMLQLLGRQEEASIYGRQATELAQEIELSFRLRGTDAYGMFCTQDGYLDRRSDALADAFAVLSGLAGEHGGSLMESLPVSPWGTPVFSPYKKSNPQGYHNRAIWPFVEAFVLLAHVEVQNLDHAQRSMASLLRAAMAFGTNKENFHAETGEASRTLLNSDRQLWSVSGMLGLYYYALFGIHVEKDNIVLSPCVPKGFAGSHWLTGVRIRDMELNLHLNGWGNEICSFRMNGGMGCPVIPLGTKGRVHVEIELIPMDAARERFVSALEDIPEPKWDSPSPSLLSWHPSPGASSYVVYRDGCAMATTAACRYPLPESSKTRCHVYRIAAQNAEVSSRPNAAYECVPDAARRLLLPLRIGERAEYRVEGGMAWLDTRPCTSRLLYESIFLEAGVYRVRVRYCNATASRRDGDTCALREFWVDEACEGMAVFPHNTEEGRWDDYSYSSPFIVTRNAPGVATFSLRYSLRCRNGNGETNQCMVRELELVRLR